MAAGAEKPNTAIAFWGSLGTGGPTALKNNDGHAAPASSAVIKPETDSGGILPSLDSAMAKLADRLKASASLAETLPAQAAIQSGGGAPKATGTPTPS